MSDDFAAYYADLNEHGGLYGALSAEFRAIGSPLQTHPPAEGPNQRGWAVYRDGSRSANASLAADERCIIFGAWMDGIHVAEGQTTRLRDVAVSIDAWISGKVRILDLATVAPLLAPLEAGIAYEAGTYLDFVWKEWLKPDEDIDVADPTQVLLLAASGVAELRQLLPYTSHGTVCFSRCLGYPFTTDTPYIVPIKGGDYEVRRPDNSIILMGNVEESLAAVVRNLPPGTGLARRGSAEQFQD